MDQRCRGWRLSNLKYKQIGVKGQKASREKEKD